MRIGARWVVGFAFATCLSAERAAAATFTLLNQPPGSNVTAADINDSGVVVGWTSATSSQQDTGFIYQNGVLTPFSVPGALATQAQAVSNSGEIVGSFVTVGDGRQFSHGFILKGSTFLSFDAPSGFTDIDVEGANNNGDIVGLYGNGGTEQPFHGFILSEKTGAFTSLDHGGSGTTISDINDLGEAVGFNGVVGFTYKDGVFTDLAVPGRFPFSINDAGEIVGVDFLRNGTGFILNPDGSIAAEGVVYPGSRSTLLEGINNHGQIVGMFGLPPTDPNFDAHQHSFMLDLNAGGVPAAAVPEPSSWALMLLGFAGLGAAIRRRRRRAPSALRRPDFGLAGNMQH
jgi:uncharacterized membrane protein